MPIKILVPSNQPQSGPRELTISAVGFDLEGTLVNSLPLHARAVREIGEEEGFVISDRESAELACYGYPGNLRKLSLGHRKDYWSRIRSLKTEATLYRDMEPLLGFLRDADVPVFAVATAPRRVTEEWLEHFRISELFRTVIYVNEISSQLKSDCIRAGLELVRAAPNATLFVGDTSADADAARKVRAIPVSVAWGAESFDDLPREWGQLVFSLPSDFRRWIEEGQMYVPSRCLTCPKTPDHRSLGAVAMCNSKCRARPGVGIWTARPVEDRCKACAAWEQIDKASRLCSTCERLSQAGRLHIGRTYAPCLYDPSREAYSQSPFTWALQRFKGLDGQPANESLAFGLANLFLSLSIAQAQKTHHCFRGPIDEVVWQPLPGVIVPVPESFEPIQRTGFSSVRALLRAFFAPLIYSESNGLMEERSEVPSNLTMQDVLKMKWPAVIQLVNKVRTRSDHNERWNLSDVLLEDGLRRRGVNPWEQVSPHMRIMLTPGASENIRGMTVFLVDDIVTSVERVNECGRVLRAAGAKRVEVLGVARTKQLRVPGSRSERICRICGSPMAIRTNNTDGSLFWACTGYLPGFGKCDHTEDRRW